METIKGLFHDILGIGVVVVTFLVDTPITVPEDVEGLVEAT